MRKIVAALSVALVIGCQQNQSADMCCAVPESTPAAIVARPAIRIDAGATAQATDAAGNVWLADTGFADGETVARDAGMAIANTANPGIYRTERFGMTAFSQPVANGKYTVKLHFAETSSAIDAVGDRVFSINVENVEIKDFDIWQKAGGREKAHVESVNVEVTDSKLDVKFTAKTQNTEINAIEIIPG